MLRSMLGPPPIERDVLARVSPQPGKRRAVLEAGRTLVQAAGRYAEEKGWDAEAVLVGSVPKGTYLTTHIDLDCFLLFPTSIYRDELERRGLEVGQALLSDHRLRYAEHPYVRGVWMGHAADVVPAYKVADPAARVSAVDRTPFHTRYVRGHLAARKRQEVRLVKQFLRGIGAYGAETAKGGVSGYLAELLVIAFGSFPRVLEAARQWMPGTALTLLDEPAHPFDAPLVFIDPVDPRRNAASAVTDETLAVMRRAAEGYLAAPDLRYFFPPAPMPPDVEAVERRLSEANETLLAVQVPTPKMREDAVVPHLRRTARSLASRLQGEGLEVRATRVEGGPDAQRGLLALRVFPRTLSPQVRHKGPPEQYASRAKDFREKWAAHPDAAGAPWKEEGRWWVQLRRERTDPRTVLEVRLAQWPLGKHLDEALGGERPPVLDTGEVLARDEGPLIAEWVLGVDPWQRRGEPQVPPIPKPENRP